MNICISEKQLENLFISSDVFPIWIQLISENCPMITIEVLHLFNELITENKENINPLINNGIITIVKPFLNCDNHSIIEQTLVIIANICLNSNQQRNYVINSLIECDIFHLLLRHLQLFNSLNQSEIDKMKSLLLVIRAATSTLACITQYCDFSTYQIIHFLLNHFSDLTRNFDDEIVTNILQALFMATKINVENVGNESNLLQFEIGEMLIQNSNILMVIVNFLLDHRKCYIKSVIGIISNIVCFGEQYIRIIVEFDALSKFGNLITHSNADVQYRVSSVIKTMTAQNVLYIEQVIDNGLIPVLVECLYFACYNTQCEITYIMLNISQNGTNAQINYLFNINNTIPNMDIFDAISTMLTYHPEIVMCALKLYSNLLIRSKQLAVNEYVITKIRQSSAYFNIEQLLQHNNSEIYSLASAIVDSIQSADHVFQDIHLNVQQTDTKIFTF